MAALQKKLLGTKTYFGKSLAALLVVATLLLPIVVKYAHAFDAHEHVVCKNADSHFHQDFVECQICHFQLASFDYHFNNYQEVETHTMTKAVNDRIVSVCLRSILRSNTQLRAPPFLLS